MAEIRELTGGDHTRTGEPIGPRLAHLLRHSRTRLTARIAELQQTLGRIDEFEATHQTDLASQVGLMGGWMGDPHASRELDPHPGGSPYGRDHTPIRQTEPPGATT